MKDKILYYYDIYFFAKISAKDSETFERYSAMCDALKPFIEIDDLIQLEENCLNNFHKVSTSFVIEHPKQSTEIAELKFCLQLYDQSIDPKTAAPIRAKVKTILSNI